MNIRTPLHMTSIKQVPSGVNQRAHWCFQYYYPELLGMHPPEVYENYVLFHEIFSFSILTSYIYYRNYSS